MSEIQFQHIQAADNAQATAAKIDGGIFGIVMNAIVHEGPGMIGRGIGKCLDAAAAVHDTCVAGVSGVISGIKDIAPSMGRERSEPAIEPVRQPEVAQNIQHACHVDMADIGQFAPPSFNTAPIVQSAGRGA